MDLHRDQQNQAKESIYTRVSRVIVTSHPSFHGSNIFQRFFVPSNFVDEEIIFSTLLASNKTI